MAEEVRAWEELENDRVDLRDIGVAAGLYHTAAGVVLYHHIEEEAHEEVDRPANHPVEVLFQIHQVLVHLGSWSSMLVHCRSLALCHSSSNVPFPSQS